MRTLADKIKLEAFLASLDQEVRGPGRIYLVGGATAVWHGWRETTIDLDLKADPEPPGFFEAIALLKESLDLNIELASPDLFIPELPGWRERSLFISRLRQTEFYHYDPYSQTLAKIERGHPRDLSDAQAMITLGLVERETLRHLFEAIQPGLIRFPSIDPATFRNSLEDFLSSTPSPSP